MPGEALRIVVFGPTGTAGAAAVRASLDDPRVAEIRAVTRRELPVKHAKLREVRCTDFADLSAIERELADLDACFLCLGISQSQARSEGHYREITVDYAVSAARALKARSPDHTFDYLSGMGTDPTGRSRMMWARVKGEAENALGALGLRRLYLFRPGYIHPEPSQSARGVGAALLGAAFPVLRALAPGIALRASELGRAMIQAVVEDGAGGVLENRDIVALAR